MVKKIGVVGSRRRDSRDDYHIVRDKLLEYYEEGDVIVSGGCPQGADSFAEEIARELGATIIIHHANWGKYKKSAGFMRNLKIAGDSDILIACVSEDRTGGTEDTVEKFNKTDKTNLVVV